MLGGVAIDSIEWQDDGKLHPVLSVVSVFDRESGQVHIRDKNAAWTQMVVATP
jgi:hypothetical protein